MPRVLIVEDDQTIRKLLAELLSAYECHTADRAEQALQYVEVEDYDVILTDLAMPGLGGVEILKRINDLRPMTPVIVISGKATEETANAVVAMGAFAYLAKPFNPDEIEDVIVRAIARRQELLEPKRR